MLDPCNGPKARVLEWAFDYIGLSNLLSASELVIVVCRVIQSDPKSAIDH